MGKLTHKDKLAIVRDVIIQKPRYWAYGYNRAIIRMIDEKFGEKIGDDVMSKLIKSVLAEMELEKTIKMNKEKLIEMHLNIFERSENSVDKTRSLIEIGKLSGHYIENIKVENVDDDKLDKLAHEIIEKRAKELVKNGKAE